MKKLFTIFLVSIAATSCADREPENLMSPCVGAKGSPCDRIPLNQQFLKNNNVKV